MLILCILASGWFHYKISYFVFLQISILFNAGAPETMSILRNKLGVKIGSTTGYTKEIMAKLKVFVFQIDNFVMDIF